MRVRPLYVAAVAFGLAAGLVQAMRTMQSDPESTSNDVMRSLGFTDRGEYELASRLLEQKSIASLSSAERGELNKLVAGKGMQTEVASGILKNLASEGLMKEYTPAVERMKIKNKDDVHVPSILACWCVAKGKNVVSRIAQGQGPLAGDAKRALSE